MNNLILTPMPAELAALYEAWREAGFVGDEISLGRLTAVRFAGLGLTLARGGLGKAQFALQTQHMLDASTGWDCVVCAGGGGGLTDETRVGDVVLGTATIEHDYRNQFNDKPVPRFEAAPEALAGLRRAAARVRGFGVLFGPIASGDEDIVTAERRAALQQVTGALAVGWEGAGGARACRFSRVPYVEVRGITDGAGPTAPGDFEANLAGAMRNVAALLAAWGREKE